VSLIPPELFNKPVRCTICGIVVLKRFYTVTCESQRCKDMYQERLDRLGALGCEHANENPKACSCPAGCYCKTRTCKDKEQQMSMESDGPAPFRSPEPKTESKKLVDPGLVLPLGAALSLAKEGKRVSRKAWTDGSWVCFMPPMLLPEGMVNSRTRKFIPKGPLDVQGYFVHYRPYPSFHVSTQLSLGDVNPALGAWTCGWQPTAADMLSDDWFEVLEDKVG
jgi:hypothetical protein